MEAVHALILRMKLLMLQEQWTHKLTKSVVDNLYFVGSIIFDIGEIINIEQFILQTIIIRSSLNFSHYTYEELAVNALFKSIFVELLYM